jgi:hypothetical protein
MQWEWGFGAVGVVLEDETGPDWFALTAETRAQV